MKHSGYLWFKTTLNYGNTAHLISADELLQ